MSYWSQRCLFWGFVMPSKCRSEVLFDLSTLKMCWEYPVSAPNPGRNVSFLEDCKLWWWWAWNSGSGCLRWVGDGFDHDYDFKFGNAWNMQCCMVFNGTVVTSLMPLLWIKFMIYSVIPIYSRSLMFGIYILHPNSSALSTYCHE